MQGEGRSQKLTGERIGGGVALALGIIVALAGPSAGALYLLVTLIGGRSYELLSVTTVAGAMAALGLGLGLLLAWQGRQMLAGNPSRPFRPPAPWRPGLLFLAVLLVGQAIISFNLLAPFTFPVFHVLGIVLPALGILALVGRSLSGDGVGATWRQVTLQGVWGGMAATTLAIILEAVAALVLIVAGALFLAAMDGIARLREWQAQLAQPGWADDPASLVQLLSSPLVLGAVLLFLALIIPLVEETCKGLGVGLMSIWQRPTPAQGWLWGIASGAGFALVEGTFNGALSLDFWAAIALLRLSTTLMHCTTTGLLGLGLAGSLQTRRPWLALGAYAISVSLHGIWNGLTLLLAVASLAMVASGRQDALPTLLSNTGVLVILGGFAAIALALLSLLAYETRRLRAVAGGDSSHSV
jgi:RsiW-degrading membrane proteinase PrsW (M82 family)